MSYDDFVSSKRRNRIIGSIVSVVIAGVVIYLVFGYLLKTKDPHRQKEAIGEVIESVGEIQIVRNFKNIPIKNDMIVMTGDFFRTKDNGRVKVKYLDDGTDVAITKNTNLIFSAVDNGKSINLGKGIVTITTPDQPSGKPMVIVTQSSEVTILEGGSFTFSFTGFDAALAVKSGKMRFRRFTDGKVLELVAGQSHTFKPAGPETIKFEM